MTRGALRSSPITGLTKRFTGTLALDRVDFDVRRGEVHALLGQNGAGKSTLIKILAGVYAADAGEIRFDGRPVDPGDREAADRLHPSGPRPGRLDDGRRERRAADRLSALAPRADLLAAGAQGRGRRARDHGQRPRSRRAGLGAARPPSARSSRSAGRWRVKADILVLDEPTAALPEADVERLLAALRRLRASGIGIIYVTHRLDEVFRIADRITVLRDGRRVATVAVAARPRPAISSRMIVGRSMSDAFVRPAPATERVVLDVEDAVAERVGPVSFTVAAGETLGLVGLRGAGHHTIGRAIFGQIPLDVRPRRRSTADASIRPIRPTPCASGSASSRAGAPRRASPPTWPCARTST